MLDVEPARVGGPGLAGLRLAGRVLVLKLERDGSAQQVLMGDGDAFEPVRDTLKVTLNVALGWPQCHARAGDL